MTSMDFSTKPYKTGQELLWSRLSQQNAQTWRDLGTLYRPNLVRLGDARNQLIVATVNENDKKTVVKSFHTEPKVLCGSNTDNLGVAHYVVGHETVYLTLVYPDFSDISDLDVSSDDTRMLVAQRSHIDVFDTHRWLTESLLAFPFAVKCRVNPSKRSIVAAVSKDQLALFDLRSSKSIGRLSSAAASDKPRLAPEVEIKRKSVPRQPSHKPSDFVWINDTLLASSSRSCPYIQLYDIRFSRNAALTLSSAKQRDSFNSGAGIEHLACDPSTNGILYGLSYASNTLTAFAPGAGSLQDLDLLSSYAKGSTMTLIHDSKGFPQIVTASAVPHSTNVHFHVVPLPTTAHGFEQWNTAAKKIVPHHFDRFGDLQSLCYNENQSWLAAATLEDWRYHLDDYEEKNVLIKFVNVSL